MTDSARVDPTLSAAVVAYLAFGDAPSWRRRPEAVPDDLRARVEVVVAAADAVEVAWGELTLGEAGDAMREQIATGHPDLSAEALAALRWKWTFDRR